jgi:hypothetical protein
MRRKIWCDVCKSKYFGLEGEVNAALATQFDANPSINRQLAREDGEIKGDALPLI